MIEQLPDVALGGVSVDLEARSERLDEIAWGAGALEDLVDEKHSGSVERQDSGASQVEDDSGAVVEGLAQTEVRSQCRGDVF